MAKAVIYKVMIEDAATGALHQMKIKATNAEGAIRKLQKSFNDAEKSTKKGIVSLAAYGVALNTLGNAVNSLTACVQGLVAAYTIQEEAETKLSTVMRNTMQATDEQVQSIKDLCSEQQKLGVIGDEVQLAGAQELATYLEKTDSLKQLIPVMNDMVAQQYGLNATQESAVNIATMLGKVMEGQTGALSRYGYSFTEAQAEILKFGTEEDRVATLADVVTASVGGMNEALAQTPSGKIKQLENTMGDLKETAGGLTKITMPFLSWTSATLTTIMQFKNLCEWIKTLSRVAKIAAISVGGIISVFVIVSEIIAHFAGSTKSATDATNDLLDAQKRGVRDAEQLEQLRKQENSTLTTTRAALEINIGKLKEFNGTKEQEKKLVNEMNSTYGGTMGCFSSVADWYNALVSNSEAYCRQMVIEARTRMLANQIAAKEQETHDLIYDEKGNKRKYSTVRQVEQYISGYYTPTGIAGGPQPQYSQREIAGSSDLDKANAAVKANNETVSNLRKQMQSAVQEAAKIKLPVIGNATPQGGDPGDKKMTELQKLNALISQYKEKYIVASEAERAEIAQTIASLNREKEALELLYKEAEVSADPKSLKEIDTAIAYQQALRNTASADAIAGIDKEIDRLKKMRDALNLAGHTPIAADQIKTFEELDSEIAYNQALMRTAEVSQRAEIQKTIDALNEKKKAWEDQLAALSPEPKKANEIQTFDELEKALNYWREKRRKASGEEIYAADKEIHALEKKYEAMGRGASILDMADEVGEIGKLKGKDLKIRLNAIGYDALEAKIKALQELLNDNHLTDDQKGEVEGLVGQYEQWLEMVSKGAPLSSQIGDGLAATAGIMRDLGGAMNENAAAWMNYAASIIDAAAKAIPAIMAVACSQAAKSASETPVVGWIMAGAAIASVIAAFAAIPKFADGGLAYGPTLGLFGEYAGAANNPEVVAPLNKLKDLIGTDNAASRYEQVDVRIDGRNLVAVLAKNSKYLSRI